MANSSSPETRYQLDSRSGSSGRDRESGSSLLVVAAVALLLGASGVVVFLVLSAEPHSAPPPLSVTLVPVPGESPTSVSPEFWGGNIGTSSPLTGTFTVDVAGTPVNYYRWPGGQAGDGINYTSGVLANATTGAPANVTWNLTQFVTWCEKLSCRAILELPAEIDEPWVAAYYVNYTERTLGFHPAYWEIGNEPALWTHFGIPWDQWNASQELNATPAQYAQVVRIYDIAIHGVDPAAPIIGLGGVGTGTFEETTWISDTVAVNGPNLSAVAIHVYPAGTPPTGTATLTEFYSNLTGARSLAGRWSNDLAAIRSACLTCPDLRLLVTEFGSASSPGSFSGFETSFPQVPFVADEIAEGLDLNVTGMYLRQLVTPHSGSWLDTATGVTHPLLELYTEILPQLGSTVVPTEGSPGDPWLAAADTLTSANGSGALLLVNANATLPVEVHAGPPIANPGTATVVIWNSSTPDPVVETVTLNRTPDWQLAPMSLLLVLTGPPSNATAALQVPLDRPSTLALPLEAGAAPVMARPLAPTEAAAATVRRSRARTPSASPRRSPGGGSRSAPR